MNSSTDVRPNSTGILFPTNSMEHWIPQNRYVENVLRQYDGKFYTNFMKNRIPWIVWRQIFQFCGKFNSTEFVENVLSINLCTIQWKQWKILHKFYGKRYSMNCVKAHFPSFPWKTEFHIIVVDERAKRARRSLYTLGQITPLVLFHKA